MRWKTGEGGVSLSRKMAKRMLKNLEDSDDVKMGVTELQKQLVISEEVGISIRQVAQQAMCENGQKIFELYRQGEEEVCIACLARWNAQVKGFVEFETRFRKYDAGSASIE